MANKTKLALIIVSIILVLTLLYFLVLPIYNLYIMKQVSKSGIMPYEFTNKTTNKTATNYITLTAYWQAQCQNYINQNYNTICPTKS